MKSISIILASVLCAGSPLMAAENSPEPTTLVQAQESRYQLGSDAIQQIRAQYEAGQYDEFLSEMEKAYQNAQDNRELEGLIELRKASGEQTIPQDKLIAGFEAIQKERNANLLKAISADQDSIFAQKVRSAATLLPSDAQEAILALTAYRTQTPGMGNNSDENQLIATDLESEYKIIHLDSLALGGKSIPDRKEKHFVLEMDRMDRMLAASAGFHDQKLKVTVETAAASYDLRLSKMYDSNDLNDLARGRVQPQNAMEEKVASIVADAHSQFAQLNQDLLMN